MSLLPICSKIFEKLIFDSIYDFIDKNNLFNNNQSGFRPSDSCIHQLIAITHNASVSASRLNNDLVKIRDWVFNWKMSFNPYPTKQAREVIFSKK